MIEKSFKLENKLGLHIRPAYLLAQIASKYNSQVTIIKDSLKVNATSILEIMSLNAPFGTEIKIIVEGQDEQDCIKELEEIIQRKFDEE